MALSKSNEPQVTAILVKDIRESCDYLIRDFSQDTDNRHELNCFLKEICSKNALSISDIIKIVRNSKESFSPHLKKVIEAFTDKQLKVCIESFIYKVVNTGYGSSAVYLDEWRVFSLNREQRKQVRKTYSIWLKIFSLFFHENIYYYDKEFINLYTTPNSDLPLYIHHDWPTLEDKELYNKRLKL